MLASQTVSTPLPSAGERFTPSCSDRGRDERQKSGYCLEDVSEGEPPGNQPCLHRRRPYLPAEPQRHVPTEETSVLPQASQRHLQWQPRLRLRKPWRRMLQLPTLPRMAHCEFGHARSLTALPMVAPANRSQVLQNYDAGCSMKDTYGQGPNSQ